MRDSQQHLTNEWPAHAAAPNTHNRVLELVRQYFPSLDGVRVCDLPCGAGAFSRRLAELGADIVPVDIAAVEPFLADPARRLLADANQRLPFDDGTFDLFVTIEGIEHLENPSYFLRECARVIKPGGRIILSTPNVDSMRSRRYAFGYGFYRFFEPVSDTDKDSGHLHPIDMVFFKGAIRRAGLEIVECTVNLLQKTWLSERLRPLLVKKLPADMRGEVPFYGDVIIYVLKKGTS